MLIIFLFQVLLGVLWVFVKSSLRLSHGWVLLVAGGGGGGLRTGYFSAHPARSTTSTCAYLLQASGFLSLGGGWRPLFWNPCSCLTVVLCGIIARIFLSRVSCFGSPRQPCPLLCLLKNNTRPTSCCVTTNTVHVFPARQTQMQSNDLLREILGVSKWGGTGGEKTFYSKNSEVRKQQTTDRTRSRHSKQIAQDHILGGGDERR